MTIKDILDTPLNDIWSVISPFAIGYLMNTICNSAVLYYLRSSKNNQGT